MGAPDEFIFFPVTLTLTLTLTLFAFPPYDRFLLLGVASRALLFGAIMPLGGATNKAQRSVVDKKGKGKKGGGDDFDEDNAFKAKQKADAAALKAMVCYLEV